MNEAIMKHVQWLLEKPAPQRDIRPILPDASEERKRFLAWDNAQNERLNRQDIEYHQELSDAQLWEIVDPQWPGRHMAPTGMVRRAAHELRRRGLV